MMLTDSGKHADSIRCAMLLHDALRIFKNGVQRLYQANLESEPMFLFGRPRPTLNGGDVPPRMSAGPGIRLRKVSEFSAALTFAPSADRLSVRLQKFCDV